MQDQMQNSGREISVSQGAVPGTAVQLGDGQTYLLASPGRRLGARVLDWLITLLAVTVGLIILFSAIAAADNSAADNNALIGLAAALFAALVIAAILYEWIFIAVAGQTLGKKAVGVKVLRVTDGAVPGAGKAFGRWILPSVIGLVPVIGWILVIIGYLSLVWDENHQTWYDRAASTVVVQAR